jgi:hypothetical protein
MGLRNREGQGVMDIFLWILVSQEKGREEKRKEEKGGEGEGWANTFRK